MPKYRIEPDQHCYRDNEPMPVKEEIYDNDEGAHGYAYDYTDKHPFKLYVEKVRHGCVGSPYTYWERLDV